MPLYIPTWSQTKTTSKQSFDKVYKVVDKLGDPVNRLSHKIGSEAFWPTTLDKESEKAARILRSFCRDGFYTDEPNGYLPASGSPKGHARVIKKIPIEVIQKAKGLAIFTTMRTGLWVSGAGGSGVLVARTASGEWSPPSGIMLHTAGLGFLVGVDIYDCVVVINTEKALQAFTKIRCTLGGEISAVAGPVGIGGILETEIHKRQAPVWNYLKSRGFYAGVQIDGTVIIERTDENERFYGERIGVADILAGKVRHPPYEIRTLMATIKAAQGDTTVDDGALPAAEPTPGDHEIHVAERSNSFGLPAADDPDPFGVHALQKEGFEIREAGTNKRASTEAFDYRPSPTSPIFGTFGTFGRHSLDGGNRLDSKRSSKQSIASIDRGTQTEAIGPAFFEDTLGNGGPYSPVKKTTENLAADPESEGFELDRTARRESIKGIPEVDEGTGQPVISRARLVTIPRRIPPALPPRSPYRKQVPIITNMDPVGSPAEVSPSPRGLGVDLGPTSPQENHADHNQDSAPTTTGAVVSPTKEDIDRKVDNLFLSPRNFDPVSDLTTTMQDPDRLSPRKKDGFDEVSMSGSDYSHETTLYVANQEEVEIGVSTHNLTPRAPAVPPARIPIVPNNDRTPEESHLDADKPGKLAEGDEFHNSSVVGLPQPNFSTHHNPYDEGANSNNKFNHSLEDLPGKFEEFHSVPSTPLEASQPSTSVF